MPEGQPLEFSGLSKRFGAVTAVSGLSARVEPGRVTGFLGPNGAGKTTTLRMLLGLVRPTAGTATVGGVRYADLPRPLQTVGAVLEASSFHPGRTAAAHLRLYAQAAGVAKARVDEVLGLVGLADAADRKIGGFSLGMRQRLGLAYALLGDPGVLVLDEPTNGLDPEGIRWIRGFLRDLAREGRTVLVSSHLLAEVQQTVDALLIISRGRLVFQGTLDELSDPHEYATVVDAPDRAALAAALTAAGVPFEVLRSGLTVRGVEPSAVGAAAAAAGVPLSSLHRRGPALEEVFLELVDGRRVHASAGGAAASGAAPGATADAGATTAPAEDAAADGSVIAPEAEGASAVEPAPVTEAVAEAEEVAEAGAVPEAAAASEADAVAEAEAASEPEVAPEAASEAEPAEPAEPTTEFADTKTATFTVASTGIIDIVPPAAEPVDEEAAGPPAAEPVDELPEDADPDVEALGEIDEELSAPRDPDRPWESTAKTDADLEADRFFAAFDGGERNGDDSEPEPAGQPEPAGDIPDHHREEGGEPR